MLTLCAFYFSDNHTQEAGPSAAPDCSDVLISEPFDIPAEGATTLALPILVQEPADINRKRKLEVAVPGAEEAMLKENKKDL